MHLNDVMAAQAGLATRAQLRALGMSPSAIGWRLARDWRLVLPGVIACGPATLDRRQRMVAALLYAGPDSTIASATAAAWHGVSAADGDPRVHMLVPAHRQLAGAGFLVIRRTTRPDRAAWDRGALRFTCPGRSVADAARDADDPEYARAVVIEAVQRGVTRICDLRSELEAGARRSSRQLRDALRDAEIGAWSVPESDLLRIARTSRILPEVWANPEVVAADGTRLPIPDGWIDRVALAIQVHSRRHHGAPEDWDATVMTDGIFAEYGVPVVGITPAHIRRNPGSVLHRLERTYLAAGERPRPDVTARRRSSIHTSWM